MDRLMTDSFIARRSACSSAVWWSSGLVGTVCCLAFCCAIGVGAEQGDVLQRGTDVFPIPLFSGRLAVLPDPAQPDLRRSQIGQTLAALGLEQHVVYLTPEQLVDPAAFNVEAFPVALYLGGEPYWQTVREPEDGDAALVRYLDSGGRLLVLPYGPLPFYYDQKYKHVGSAGRFGMRMGASGFSSPPDGRKLVFHRTFDDHGLDALPERFRFPLPYEADQRWRPINGPVGPGTSYRPWISLHDETGRSYEDGAATVEFESGGRLLYVWCSLIACDQVRPILLLAALRYALDGLTPPPARLACPRTPQTPVVDGILDESIWRVVPAARHFVAVGEPLRAASRLTAVQACWDAEKIYLAFRCHQVSTTPASDAVQVWLAGKDANQPKIHLTLSADNRLDIRSGNVGGTDAADDSPGDVPRIDSEVQYSGQSWTAEIAIPFAALPSELRSARFGDVLPAQFARRVQATSPESDTAGICPPDVWSASDDPSRIDGFGALVLSAHPWSDDFDAYPPSADGSGVWTFSGGSWRIEDGTLVGQDSCADWSQLQGAFRGDDRWRDYCFSARFRVESRGSSRYDGPWFGVRCSTEGDGYVLQFGADTWYLHKIVFGIATRAHNCLAQGPCTPGDAWHTLRLETRANRIKAMLNDQLLFDVVDDAHLELPSRRRGGIVLAAGKSSQSQGSTIVRYDDVVIELLED
jgi:hypothetical protein